MGLFSKKDKIVDKYKKGLEEPKRSFGQRLKEFFSRHKKIDEEFFDELENLLISADVGARLSIEIINKLKNDVKFENIKDQDQIIDKLKEILENLYNYDDYNTSLNISDAKPTVILVMGVNGVGKTTSIAKLAHILKENNKKVLLVAADTFRAGAVEQLETWSNRIKVDIVSGLENSDPSSVIFNGVKKGKEEEYDFVIIDTAGRLQTKTNLMNEANKMYRVISKIIPDAPNESLLVLDATIGQNGVFQAQAFLETAKITGIILTKMDGTSKGGIVLSIKQELNIPVKFIGLGEKIDDLVEFDLKEYLDTLTRR